MAKFFIDRPILAIVIALILMLGGALAILTLPVAQYPTIAPPSIQVRANYPGASASTVESTVVQVIEQQMNGLDNLQYLSSTSDDAGIAQITLTFAAGTDPNIAQVQVQNKLQLATPQLPATVQQAGISVTKSSNSFLLIMAFVSADGSMTRRDLANFVASRVQDPISRVPGVGTVQLFGTQYAMRVWFDPTRLTAYGLTPVDVSAAIAQQNVQVAGGQLGGLPQVRGQQLTATITEATLLRTPRQFGAILLKVDRDGSPVRLRDVARIELGAENYNFDTKFGGAPAAGFGVQLATGANALATADAVRARLAQLSTNFPPGLKVEFAYDTTPFIRLSIEELVKTLFEGIVLVFLVMYLFLQNLRATLIPTIAVPVVLLGTFGVMAAAGFSINTLTMFGLVLAIGLLVDDAIVVVENVERVMEEEGLSPLEATRKAMSQITGALVGVALVLSAVFVPTAFTSGSVGAIYRQFSLTIVAAMVLSVLVAIVLTPALCVLLLKPHEPGHAARRGFFGWFNRTFDRSRDRYHGGVARIIARPARWLVLYGAVFVAVGLMFWRLPTSFLPEEDQGVMYVQVQTPPGATQGRTQAVLDEVANYLLQDEARMVAGVLEITGNNFAGRGQNSAQLFVRLKDWSERRDAELGLPALVARIQKRYGGYKDANIVPINPPPIPELGTASGFDFELQDRAGLGHERLMQARDALLAEARADPALSRVRPNGQNDVPQYHIDVDREKAGALGVPANLVDQTFSIAWASQYVNNFLDVDNRIKRVYVQADAPFRMDPEDLSNYHVRNIAGGMVPLDSIAQGRWAYGSPRLERYNGISAVQIQGSAAPGRSTGDAMAVIERIAAKLPAGFGYEWTGLSFQERLSGKQAPYLYAISLLVVFLSLAALYESWSIPVSVLMVVPLGIAGALAAATMRGLSNDVYFQVGLLTTIGLSAKNAILIVEFARELQAQGKSAVDAALEAARLRLRPILMTSLAFILGVLPLAVASGAGSGSQRAIGTGVIGGMLSATFLAIFLIPMFYVVVVQKLGGKRAAHGAGVDADPGTAAGAAAGAAAGTAEAPPAVGSPAAPGAAEGRARE